MREWIEVCSSCMTVLTPPEAAPAEPATDFQPLLPEMRSEIVSILASLLLEKRWEATQ
jgi:hypothetical protein